MKAPAKSSAKSQRATSAAPADEVESVETVESVDTVETVDEVASVETPIHEGPGPDYNATPANTKMVRFALTTALDPAPRVGHIDLVHFTGKSSLARGVHELPYEVAVVLADKKYGEIVG